jgi:acyl-CoA reductase-like NAD-dependent aldehyde dehydrogenase
MATINVVDPLTGNTLHEIESHSASDVALRFQSAKEAQPAWAALGGKARARVASRLVDALIARQEELMDMLQRETGKSRSHAFEEITGALAAISYYAKVTPKLMRRQKVRGGVPLLITAYTEPAPVGAVGIVTPWNYPLALTMMDVIPALMAGNAVVQKADNQTAKTVELAREIAVSAGVPEEVWQVVHGEASEVGNALIDHCDYLAFTGSTATGKIVAQRAASRLIGYSLELGGKNPMIVLPGANVAEAAEMALASAFGNAGQLCVAIERLYVPNHAMAAFELELKKRVETLKVGSSSKFEFDLGALSSAAQLERVSGFVKRAIDEGARLVTWWQGTDGGGSKLLRTDGPSGHSARC